MDVISTSSARNMFHGASTSARNRVLIRKYFIVDRKSYYLFRFPAVSACPGAMIPPFFLIYICCPLTAQQQHQRLADSAVHIYLYPIPSLVLPAELPELGPNQGWGYRNVDLITRELGSLLDSIPSCLLSPSEM